MNHILNIYASYYVKVFKYFGRNEIHYASYIANSDK